MMDQFFVLVERIWAALPFSAATWGVIITLCVTFYIFIKASKDANSPVRWEDLIINHDTSRADPYRVAYLVGVFVATWIVISLADKSALSFDIFGLYLAYLLGGASWSGYIQNKRDIEYEKIAANTNAEDGLASPGREHGPKS